jgi:hypothetical protein
MAFIVLQTPKGELSKIVFTAMTLETAETIANHMNTLNINAAKKIGQAVKFVYKVIGK